MPILLIRIFARLLTLAVLTNALLCVCRPAPAHAASPVVHYPSCCKPPAPARPGQQPAKPTACPHCGQILTHDRDTAAIPDATPVASRMAIAFTFAAPPTATAIPPQQRIDRCQSPPTLLRLHCALTL